jgi:hypothetical protein
LELFGVEAGLLLFLGMGLCDMCVREVQQPCDDSLVAT